MSAPHHITLWPRSLAWRAQIWRTGLSDAIRRYGRNALIMLAMLCVAATSALAQLRIEITEGVVAPTPIAIANFTGADGVETDEGRLIASIIANDLVSSGLFEPIDEAAFIAPPGSPSIKPNFANWAPLGAKGLLVGSAELDENGKLQVEFVLWDVVTERDLTSGAGSADPDAMRQLSHKIADLVYEEFTGDTGYFDTQIVYVAEAGSQTRRVKRLAIMDQDGHNHKFLTSGLDLVLTPRFSPTTQEIAYLNFFNDEPNVYIQDIRSGRSERLGSFPGMTFAPRFGPKGDRLIMSWAKDEDGASDIYEMDLRTQEIRQLTNSRAIDTAPSYSPDGKRVVFESNRAGRQQIYTMTSNGKNVQRISYGEGRYATPVWSPRGDIIAFTKMLRGIFYIGVMNIDGTGERLLAEGFLVEGPTWAPNGRVLMYFKQEPFTNEGDGGEAALYRIDITGYNERRIITPSQASDPAWSPLRR
ncbi:MAG: Dipeptidyl-peptidase 5 [SAR116 cluster bacterium]|nr:MAG: Dipeptidyl-peptidase 5 [SAR116 cluster bacterium]